MYWLDTKVSFTLLSAYTLPACRWVSRVEKLRVCDVSSDILRHDPPSPLDLCCDEACSAVCHQLWAPWRQSLQHAVAHTLTPWHVPLLTNPPLTPLCSITLDNRTINDHCADLRGQPALAESDGIFPFASVEGHIGFLYNLVNTQELLYVSRLSYCIPGNIGRFPYNIRAAPWKLIFLGLKQLEIWTFEDNIFQKRGCGYHFNYGWAD